MEHKIQLYTIQNKTNQLIPYFDKGIQAGFPSPAADYMELAIDLNETLIKNPSSTFIGRITGESMKDIGIFDGSLAIVDKSLRVENNSLVVAWIDGGFTLKQIRKESGSTYLMAFNRNFKPVLIDEANQGSIWGKVTYIINKAL